jgi:hypothetical protein
VPARSTPAESGAFRCGQRSCKADGCPAEPRKMTNASPWTTTPRGRSRNAEEEQATNH